MFARITPAYAGNTVTKFIIWNDNQDHPRIRGEHCKQVNSKFGIGGSPPHTRGTQTGDQTKAFFIGITPAYAGNTFFRKAYKGAFWDHPRIRGEHLYSSVSRLCSPGSPPHTRGTHVSPDYLSPLAGITPAYAGNTFFYL